MHGDDATATGPKDNLYRSDAALKRHCELTVGGRLGSSLTDNKDAQVLNRVIPRMPQGTEYEADRSPPEKPINR